LPALLKICQKAGYMDVFLLEYEIVTRGMKHGQRGGQAQAMGKKSRQRLDVVLPGICAFEVHGPDHARNATRSKAYKSDVQKVHNTTDLGIPLAELTWTQRKTWSSIVHSMLEDHGGNC
jgi:hypothetical protein